MVQVSVRVRGLVGMVCVRVRVRRLAGMVWVSIRGYGQGFNWDGLG